MNKNRYNPCEQCPRKYPECKECDYYEVQRIYFLIKRDLKKYAQCKTCVHDDCRNRELYGALGQNCSDWKYMEEPR